MGTLQTTGAYTLQYKEMRILSQPLQEIVGKGHNAKYVKDCVELYLSNKNIEQLAGFNHLVNLEVLWLNDNKLQALDGLESNIRMKQLYAQYNNICTLKGSLCKLKFLKVLDLSNNQLRDLNKLLKSLAKMRFMENLNIQGNPCCEEPDYRLMLIHAMPSLQVLDHHQVTPAERLQAAALIGGDAHMLNVAFGAGVPTSVLQHRTAAAQCQRPECSVLEQDLAKMVESIKWKQQQATETTEAAQAAANPDAEYWMPRSTLPPNPGLLKAQQAWAAATAAHSATATTTSTTNSNIDDTIHSTHRKGTDTTALRHGTASTTGSCSATVNVLQLTSVSRTSSGGILMDADALAAAASRHKPKDVLLLHRYSRRNRAAGQETADSSVAHGTSSSGKVHPSYLQGTFGHRLTERSWDEKANALKL